MEVYVKTTTSSVYQGVAAATPRTDAKLIYMGSEGSVFFNQTNSGWFGTIYAKTSLTFGQGVILVGAYATPGTVNMNQGNKILEYVLADYARDNW